MGHERICRRCFRSPARWPIFAAVACLALGASSSQGGEPVLQLPPLFVREHRGGPTWRYTSAAGIEVLSRCDDRTTQAYFTAFLRRKLELDALLPPSLQIRQEVPLALILITPAVERSMNDQLVSVMNSAMKGQTSGYVTPWASGSQIYHVVRTIPQLTLSDSESTGMIYTLDPSQREPPSMGSSPLPAAFRSNGAYGDITFTPGRIGSVLGGRVPPLPAWFKSGFLSLSEQITWTSSENVRLDSVLWVSNGLTKRIIERNKAEHSNPAVPNAITASYTLSPASDGDNPIRFFPMLQLFAGPGGGTVPFTLDEYELWKAQVSLFLHWAYADPKRREALWTFVDLSSRQAVTDDLVTRCFGLDSADLGRALAAALPTAVKTSLALLKTNAITLPKFSLQNASAIDIARIQGDMGRKEIAYVKDGGVGGIEPYVDQVGASLLSLYREGERDPGLLAVVGLYFHDLASEAEALPCLEAAARAHVRRPAVYVALAQIRYQSALAQPTGGDGKLGAEQVGEILGLVKESCWYAPPQPETYALALNAWTQAATPPNAEDLALLDEGVVFFPEDFALVSGAAKLCARCGFIDEALAQIDRGLEHAAPDYRERLTELRAELTAQRRPLWHRPGAGPVNPLG